MTDQSDSGALPPASAVDLERDALLRMFTAYQDLKALGWNDAIYCPKDGTWFDAIEAGSAGVHTCQYEGTWPDGGWWVADGDLSPSRPILFRLHGKEDSAAVLAVPPQQEPIDEQRGNCSGDPCRGVVDRGAGPVRTHGEQPESAGWALIVRLRAAIDALEWIVNLAHGVGRAGAAPEYDEWEAALEAGKLALLDHAGRAKG